MKTLKPSKGFELQIDGEMRKFKDGWEYTCPDALMDSIINAYPAVSQVTSVFQFINTKQPPKNTDYTNKKLLISRTGGIGDFFFILRVVKQIKEKYSGVEVVVSCAYRYSRILQSLFTGLIDRVISLPFTKADYDRCDYLITFENFIEGNPSASYLNAFDLASERFGIETEGDHSLPIKILDKFNRETEQVKESWGETRKKIGIQLNATAILRSYPPFFIAQLCKYFDEAGYDVLLLDTQKNINDFVTLDFVEKKNLLFPYTLDVTGSFELSVALAKECELIICPDSSFTYVADSLGIPVIAIYSPFSSALRADKLNVYAIEVGGDGCYNCCTHSELPCKRARDGKYSPCLKAISPEFIFTTTEKILNKEM